MCYRLLEALVGKKKENGEREREIERDPCLVNKVVGSKILYTFLFSLMSDCGNFMEQQSLYFENHKQNYRSFGSVTGRIY